MTVTSSKPLGANQAMQVGWTLLHCVRVKRADYLGVIERTRRDRIGFYRDYALVRSGDRLSIENGMLEALQAVPLRGRVKGEPRKCRVTDARVWTSSRDEIHALLRSMIVTGRQ